MTGAWITLILALLLRIDSASRFADDELLIPEFDRVPPYQSYYSDAQSNLPIRVSCLTWPPAPLSSVSYYTASRAPGSGTNQMPTTPHHHPQVPLYPLRESLVRNESSGLTVVLSNPTDLASLDALNVHCIASTPFGSILSNPFRLLRAGMDDFPGTAHNSEPIPSRSPEASSIVVHRVLPGNVAAIRCRPPKSRPAAQVEFLRDGSPLAPNPQKHLLTVSNVEDQIVLLIGAFEQSDEGVYQCVATNPVTKQKWIDPRSYKLELRGIPSEHTTKLVYGFADRRELVVEEGANVTLYCVFETWPKQVPSVEQVSDSTASHKRHRFDEMFGTLHLTGLLPEDNGWYRCAAGTASSTVFLRVKRKPRVSLSPSFVSVPQGTSVTLNCSSSGPSVPTWYFNGRIKLSQRSTGLNSQLFIPSVDSTTAGVYQCVIYGDTDDTWISAQSVISLDSRRPIRKADYDQFVHGATFTQESHTIVSGTLPSSLIELSCLPSEPHLTRLMQWLSEVIPGQDDIRARLNLAHRLGFLAVHWRKDGVQLQLPTDASGLLQLNLSLTRSVDFGTYRCEVSAARRVLFAHETRVQPVETIPGGDSPKPRLLNHWDNSDIGAPFAEHPEPDESSVRSILSNLSHSNDPTDRDKRNVLSNRAPTPLFGTMMMMRAGYPDGLTAFADQAGHDRLDRSGVGSLSQSGPDLAAPGDLALRLQRPNASTFGDNLAALISWSAVKADFYRILFRKRLPMSTSWSKPSHAEETVTECCGQVPECCHQTRHIYMTNRQRDGLEPGHLYQFRIQAFVGQSLAGKSSWSDIVSFEHISKVAPVITETERLADGSMLARWTLATSAVGFPIDHFLLLYRPEARMANGKITYDGFKTAFVDNGETREFKLHDLEPGKGYQIVVYGVHTPPGLDPHTSIFKGAIGGRRITQFSHEIFVKPRDDPADSRADGSLDSANNVPGDTGTATPETSLAFNSAESNRLMFLILGALAGLMILIMMCLVILCVWRQQRDKQRLLLYCNSTDGAGTKSADGHMEEPPPPQTRPLPGSGTFMLNHLNALDAARPTDSCDTHRSRQLSHRSSLIYPQPPPMSPPPPPPLNKQLGFGRHPDDALEMTSLMSDYAQQRHVLNPASLPPAQQYPAPPSMMLEQQPYWTGASAAAVAQQQQQHMAMTGSKYSGQFVPINYYPSNSTMAHNLPYGMKREPPSGGSVHDGTDTECDVLDQGAQFAGNEQQQQQQHLRSTNPLSPGPHMEQTNMPYQCVPPASFPNYAAQQMIYDHAAQQQCHPHHFQPIDAEPTHSYYQQQQQQLAYPSYSARMAHLGPHMVVGQYDPGLGTPPPTATTTAMTQPPHPVPGLLPYSSFDPRVPAGSLPKSSLSLGHPPEADYLRHDQLCGSIQSDNRHHHHHHRRRRRRLTADSGHSDNPERDECRQTGTDNVDTGTAPLMTSSPVTRELPPQLMNHRGHRLLEDEEESDTPPPLPQHHPSTCYSPAVHRPVGSHPRDLNGQDLPSEQLVNGGGPPDWGTAYSASGWLDPRHVVKSGHGLPPQIPAHHRPYHISGPLTYGQHNPGATATAPNSLTRRTTPAALLNSPPRVRDYSEYGIPNIHHPPETVAVQGSVESVNRGRAPVLYPPRSSNGPDMRFTPLGQTTS